MSPTNAPRHPTNSLSRSRTRALEPAPFSLSARLLRPSADVAARGFRLENVRVGEHTRGMTSGTQTIVIFACPNCGVAYQTTQQQHPDDHSGSFKCQDCQTEVHAWSGVFSFFDWKAYEACSIPKPWPNQTDHHPSPLLPHGRVN
jgi:predicted RNA-binding Zn-ribbon protein involved in translation (DUF1610 family)